VTEVDLSLEVAAGTGALVLRVADAGRGFDAGPPRPEDGLGLIAMRQRAEAMGGHLTVRAAPGKGTVVTAVVAPGRAS